MTRLFGRAVRGVRVLDAVPRNYGSNVTILGRLSCQGLDAAMTIKGPTDTQSPRIDGTAFPNAEQIIDALEATAAGWNRMPTPLQRGGKRYARRLRSRQRRHALGRSGACHLYPGATPSIPSPTNFMSIRLPSAPLVELFPEAFKLLAEPLNLAAQTSHFRFELRHAVLTRQIHCAGKT